MRGDLDLRDFALAMPKVELHVHLEGTIRPATLLALAARRRISLPASDEAGIRQWLRFRNFADFVEIYLTCCRCLRDPEDFRRLMEEFLAEQDRQAVLHSEVHFSIGTHLANGVNGQEVADALGEALEGAERRWGVSASLIPDIVRNQGPARADAVLEWAVEGRSKGVVALGLSGFESEPDEPFREHFRLAAAEGLRRVAHAGEQRGPESIRSVLEVCGAERIGHGIRAGEDPDLLAYLRERELPLEVSPTSNLRLGVVASLAAHPFDLLRREGLALTVNSDDPAFFHTTLAEEYLSLARAFGYGAPVLERLARDALRYSFLVGADRGRLEAEFDRRFAELGGREAEGEVVGRQPSQGAPSAG